MNYNHTHLFERTLCCPFPNLQEKTNQLHVKGVQLVPKYIWWRWEFQEHKETKNQYATWTSVPIKLQITYKWNSGENSGEETWEKKLKNGQFNLKKPLN